MKVNAYAANEPKGKLENFTYELGEIGSEEVDIKVAYCGICHSDLSMINNEWGMTNTQSFPVMRLWGKLSLPDRL